MVKADAYGHGAICIARAAEQAGVAAFAVALVEEGIALREAGITAPVLVLSEAPPEAYADAVAHELTLTVYSHGAIAHAEAAAQAAHRAATVHLKIDTGMHRVGAEPGDAAELARRLAASTSLAFEGLFTHLAVADEPGDPFTGFAARRFAAVRATLSSLGIAPPITHAANSAACARLPRGPARSRALRHRLLRLSPGAGTGDDAAERRDAHARPGALARASTSYGCSPRASARVMAAATSSRAPPMLRRCRSATPTGCRARSPPAGGEVLVRGRRRRIAGTVTMDQLLVDCGPDGDVEVGDEVVLIGEQGTASVSAQEWAARTGTIVHEILTSIGPRVPRVVVNSVGARPATAAAGQRAEGPRDGRRR